MKTHRLSPRSLPLLAGLLIALSLPATADAAFGISAFDGEVAADSSHTPFTQAGGHPYSASTNFDLKTTVDNLGTVVPEGGQLRSVVVDLPAGLIGNPTAATVCSGLTAVLENSEPNKACPLGSIVGLADVPLSSGPDEVETNVAPVFNVKPPAGVVARFAFAPLSLGVPVVLDARLRSDGDYGVTIEARNLPQASVALGSAVTLWGTPADPSHDEERCLVHPIPLEFFPSHVCIGEPNTPAGPNPAGIPSRPFITNPSACTPAGVGLLTTLTVESWNPASMPDSATFVSHNPPGYPLPPAQWGSPQGPTGCGDVPFDPLVEVDGISTAADSPTGLGIRISVPTAGLENPTGIAQSTLKTANVVLPQGMTVNPAAARGLDGCTPPQLNAETAESPAGSGCPDGSKIGTVEIKTPLLEENLGGSVFLAAPKDNPFGALLSLYIVVKSPERGVLVTLAGRVDADPDSGRLVTSFDQNPQLPFESLQLSLFAGSTSPLITPPTCGTHTIASELSPWARPTAGVHVDSKFQITSGPDGAPCPSPGQFDPTFEAGTVGSIAGDYSPLIVKAARPDGSGPLSGLSVKLPEGLLAKLAGVPACSAAALQGAEGKSGAEEVARPSCPADSRVGAVDVAAGAGSSPFHVAGTAYLAGPYKGAPLSIAVITPALAGPFDLGTVVTRATAQINPVTAQIDVTSDPIPTILEGIPLKVRSIGVNTDRSQFTINPTDCDPMALSGTLFGAGTSRAVSNRFQVGACKALGFKPKLSLALKGAVHRRAHPSLRATLTARVGDANIARAQVKLPKAAFLDNAHINGICTRVEFARGTCPSGSIYGRATASSPLLDYEVAGPVYLRSNPEHRLPDLVVAFRGPDHQPITVELAGKTDSVKGALRNTFEAVPDVPVSRFSLTLFGGKKGLVEMSSGFCRSPRAQVKLGAQSGAIYDTSPRVKARCGWLGI